MDDMIFAAASRAAFSLPYLLNGENGMMQDEFLVPYDELAMQTVAQQNGIVASYLMNDPVAVFWMTQENPTELNEYIQVRKRALMIAQDNHVNMAHVEKIIYANATNVKPALEEVEMLCLFTKNPIFFFQSAEMVHLFAKFVPMQLLWKWRLVSKTWNNAIQDYVHERITEERNLLAGDIYMQYHSNIHVESGNHLYVFRTARGTLHRFLPLQVCPIFSSHRIVFSIQFVNKNYPSSYTSNSQVQLCGLHTSLDVLQLVMPLSVVLFGFSDNTPIPYAAPCPYDSNKIQILKDSLQTTCKLEKDPVICRWSSTKENQDSIANDIARCLKNHETATRMKNNCKELGIPTKSWKPCIRYVDNDVIDYAQTWSDTYFFVYRPFEKRQRVTLLGEALAKHKLMHLEDCDICVQYINQGFTSIDVVIDILLERDVNILKRKCNGDEYCPYPSKFARYE